MGFFGGIPPVARIPHLAHATRAEQSLDAGCPPTIVGDEYNLVTFLDGASVKDDIECLP